MNLKKHQKTFGIALIALAGLFGVVFMLNFFLKRELKEIIGRQLSGSSVKYEEISVSVFKANSTVTHPKLKIGNYAVKADKIRIHDFSYFEFLVNNKIVIGGIDVSKPEVIFNKNEPVSEVLEKNEDKNKDFGKEISIKNLNITGGYLKIKETDSASNTLYFSIKELNFYDIVIHPKIFTSSLPFVYKRGLVESDSVFYELNAEHSILLKKLKLKDGNLELKDLQIIPKYSKAEFDQRISVEKDRFDLKVNSIKIKDFDWKFENDSLQLKSSNTNISGAEFKIYRNKLLPDDTSIKPMYSQMIRELGTKIKFDSILIEDSQIEYEEKVDVSSPPGILGFYDLRAEVVNITNMGMKSKDFPKTKIHAETRFMNESNLILNWEFDVRNVQDQFEVSGSLAEVSAGAMNSFLKPTINVVVEGDIESLYFNFQGNKYLATGDMRLKYNNFKVKVLKKDGAEKNAFLSGIVNIFVKKEANSKKLEQKGVEAERDRTKSFWNYLWTFIRNGALKSFL